MNKIIFFSIFFLISKPFFAQETTNVKTSCQQSNLHNYHENARQCNDIWIQANDLIVPINDDFVLNQIKLPVWMDEGYTMTDIDVYYYDDNSGVPGNQIGLETNLTPTSQTLLESNFGYDFVEVIIDLTPFIFHGQVASETTYWVGLHTDNAGADPWYIHLETSSETSLGHPMAQGKTTGGAFTIPDGDLDGVYTFYGDCPNADVEDYTIKASIYPNPVQNRFKIETKTSIDKIIIYTILGNKILSTSKKEIDVGFLSKGTYIVKLVTGNQSTSFKLLKE